MLFQQGRIARLLRAARRRAIIERMNVLVIGGNRFMGVSLVWRLLFAGHRVTMLNRGRLSDPYGDRVERLRADRGTDAFDAVLANRSFDRVVDLAGFSGDDARRAVRVLAGRIGHYVFVSTGQVYLVRESCPRPSREGDYPGPVMAGPPVPEEHDDWAYGIGKRDAEDVLVAAPDLPSTRLRIPMVNGERDPKRRFEAYLWRMLDGGPLLLPRGDAIARHVYRGAVVDAICRILEAPPAPGDAYNLAQREMPTVRELVELIARRVGASPRIVEVEPAVIEQAGLSVRAASPFSSRWMSLLDPSRAEAELGFVHPPLATYVDAILAELLASWPSAPPEGYHQRA
ncbi:MAG: epimerase, partial [Myxococcales bacterium]|nr:epimerase [Myxococcales bacterium]